MVKGFLGSLGKLPRLGRGLQPWSMQVGGEAGLDGCFGLKASSLDLQVRVFCLHDLGCGQRRLRLRLFWGLNGRGSPN